MKQSGPDSLKAGDVVARRYVILRQLREEPCGGVWLAQDRALGLDVGLKFVPRRWPQYDEAKGALRREAALAFKLRHPHILSVLHFDEGEEGAYLIQEPFAGETLLAHLSRLERFRIPQALTLLEQVAQALALAHEHHEVHQTLDPFHVLLLDQSVKLANFACPRVEEDDEVSHIELKAYVAPEVLRGERVTPAANVFSLGVLGFRLTAGSLPYPLTFDEPFPYRLESMPADLEEIPLPLQNLLLQCLAPDPPDRFEDAGAFLVALEQRRELWRTPQERWIGWTPEGREGARGAAAQMFSRLWDGGKSAVGKIGEGFKTLKDKGEPGIIRRWLIGLAVILLALVTFIWGGRALLRQAETPPAPAPSAQVQPAPREVKLPPAGGPPLGAVAEPARPVSTPAAAPPTVKPAPTLAAQAPAAAKEDRYQLLVATYANLEQARTLKKRLQAKNMPATVYRSTTDQKTYYVVKAGPFTGKKQAEDAAQRLKSEERLAHLPKVVKMTTTDAKTPPKKAPR